MEDKLGRYRNTLEDPEFTKNWINLTKDLQGITLTNTDPKADYLALINKNQSVFEREGFILERKVEAASQDTIKITVIIKHSGSGKFRDSEIVLPKACLEEDSPETFFFSRLLYEGLLFIASSNDAIEAELFGPKRKHRDIPKPYDPTADFIEFAYYDQTGKECIKKLDRRKFEKLFLGMTSEEEAETVFEVPEYRRFSWSDIKLFFKCKRCFYNIKTLGCRPTNFEEEGSALEKITDTLLKREFDGCREKKEVHPIMRSSKAVRPLKDDRLKIWQHAWVNYQAQGIQYHDVWGNWMVYGGVDDIWLNENHELIVVDYKSTTRENPVISNEYKKQLEFYAWILKQRNYNVAPIGYLLFYTPITDKLRFDWKLDFKPQLIEVPLDTSWVQEIISDALGCLLQDTEPEIGFNMMDGRKQCSACLYFEKLSLRDKKQALLASI